MRDSAKLTAAVVGGYLLGRTKKGKTAIGLALWLSGNRLGNPRAAITTLATSPEVAKLAAQVRGPLLAAAQRAVAATIESRTTALADSLHQRTSQLIEISGSSEDEPVDDADQEESVSPRATKRQAKAVRRTPAQRSTDENPEPARSRKTARSRESGRGREPARRRSAPRGGDTA
ncbi:hypothetical protein HC028_05595 [Planosporangium flavigriseum]|uniref:Uncharacterized protein n=1 Tax=Planosporangium flavigriseum TaxID=373681 RepID=A0A8J3LGE3_9ACTN|nr:hypothetical protein [Planosporangium flavigriseum]NJC63984.1 hypothetical protein [Planosporangium flavigriseum]GIG72863.1 hypothetical protein Pfl04_12670 [Planosporangium flavigriseum]